MTFLANRATHVVERMDDPSCDPSVLWRTYEQFALINRFISGWHGNYQRFIKPHLSSQTFSTLLDIGSGAGDIPRALHRWARRDGLLLAILGIDPDERAYRFATAQPSLPGVTFRSVMSYDLVAEGATFDFVISNHVLHHLDDTERTQLLGDSELLTRNTAIHTDIARNRLGYLGFAALTLPFAYRSFIHSDGLTSIRRSYTHEELAAIAPQQWNVERQSLFRLALLWNPPPRA